MVVLDFNEIFNKIIEYSNSLVNELFGECYPSVYRDAIPKWFRIDYPFTIRADKNVQLSMFLEMHQFSMNNNVNLMGNLGFTLFFDKDLTDIKKIKSSIFNVSVYGCELKFKYRCKKEFNNNNEFDKSEINVVVFNGHVYDIIDDCFNIIRNSFNNGTYIDLINKINAYLTVSGTRSVGLIVDLTNKTSTVNRGIDYYSKGNVLNLCCKSNNDVVTLEGVVLGSNQNKYNTTISFDNKHIISHSCNCPAHQSYEGPCKHVVSLMMEYSFLFSD